MSPAVWTPALVVSALLVTSTAAARPQSTWTIQTTPNPASNSFLNAVSCPSPTFCVAVGDNSVSSGHTTLAEHWNGSSWTVKPTPNPTASGQYPDLVSVSCVSATACMAVGLDANSGGGVAAFSERWDGSKWTLVPIAKPPGSPSTWLYSVSCTSASACTAVGQSKLSKFATLAERWNGSTWSIQPTPDHADVAGTAGSALMAVSCSTATECVATGTYGPAGALANFSERWNGTGWTLKPMAAPAGTKDTRPWGISCPVAGSCASAGSYRNNSDQRVTFGARWNGSGWAVQSTPNPMGSLTAVLSSVSCGSASACTAVGDSVDGSYIDHALAESWNGSSWAAQNTPTPSAATATSLSDVSCSSPTACTAVGYYIDGSGYYKTLVERRTG
jgi:hypothetical protein